MDSPVGPGDLLDQAWLSFKNNKIQQAIHLLESHPKSSNNPRYASSLAYFYYLQGDYETASTYAQRSLQLEPTHRRALTVLGEIAFKENNPDKAFQYFQEAYRQSSDNVYVATRLAFICLSLDKPEEAVSVLEKTREKHPRDITLLEMLQFAYLSSGDPEQSRKIFSLISDISNEYPEAARSFMPRKFEMMDPEPAVRMLLSIFELKHYHDNVDLRYVAAKKLMALSRYQEAAEHLEYVARKRPRSDHVLLKLATCHVNCDNNDRALGILEKFPSAGRRESWHELYLRALVQSGREQQAMDEGISFLLTYPRNKAIRKIVNSLRKKGIKPIQTHL